MTKTVLNLQDSFLNQVRKDGAEVTVVMLDGTLLDGLVKGFDNFTLILYSQGRQHLLYKHAISHISASKNHRNANNNSTTLNKKKSAFNPIDFSHMGADEK